MTNLSEAGESFASNARSHIPDGCEADISIDERVREDGSTRVEYSLGCPRVDLPLNRGSCGFNYEAEDGTLVNFIYTPEGSVEQDNVIRNARNELSGCLGAAVCAEAQRLGG